MKFLYYPWKKGKAISQYFGTNPEIYKPFGINGHNGWDIAMEDGTPVRAAHDGVVVYTGIEAKEGMGVVIRTDAQYLYEGKLTYFKTIYWHNRYPDGIKVKVGDKVRAGDIISFSDNTGFSSGPHLHFGLKPIAQGENEWTWSNYSQNNGFNGAIDPGPYFNAIYAEDIPKIISLSTALVAALEKLIALLKRR